MSLKNDSANEMAMTGLERALSGDALHRTAESKAEKVFINNWTLGTGGEIPPNNFPIANFPFLWQL